MANRLFQNMVQQMKAAAGRQIGVLDDTGAVVACSEPELIGEQWPADGLQQGSEFRQSGRTFRPLAQERGTNYAVFVEGEDPEASRIAAMVAVSLENLKLYYDEKYDKSNFIKNVVMDNILPGDIYAKARELHFSVDTTSVVLLVRILTENPSVSPFDVVSSLFTDNQRDFVFTISESDIVVVKEIRQEVDSKAIESLAGSIVDVLEGEHYIKAAVGVGMMVTGIKELANSFKEAQVALEVGKVFDTERSILRYDNLGIARLIYQLPTTLCEMFLKEVFKKGSIDSLDQETLFTIQRFFENNLNVSETSRGLFVHRNTLVYRIEKIKKLTGLDLREFDDAIVFKVALMVKKYLDANPTKY